MPFFLVTHRSLVEADSDHEAVVKALEKIENGGKLDFEVKFDEATITHVVISGRNTAKPSPKSQEKSTVSEHTQSVSELPSAVTTTEEYLAESRSALLELRRPDRRTTTIVSLFLGGLVVMMMLLGTF